MGEDHKDQDNAAGSIILILMVLAHADKALFSVSQDLLRDLIMLGIVAAGLQLCITSAFRFAEAVVISSMRYLQIPLAAFVGFLLFNEVMARAITSLNSRNPTKAASGICK